MTHETTWLNIVEVGDTGKTSIYEVRTKDNNPLIIGYIKWFGKFRKYALYPAVDSVFESDCLEDIAKFLKMLMHARRVKQSMFK